MDMVKMVYALMVSGWILAALSIIMDSMTSGAPITILYLASGIAIMTAFGIVIKSKLWRAQ